MTAVVVVNDSQGCFNSQSYEQHLNLWIGLKGRWL